MWTFMYIAIAVGTLRSLLRVAQTNIEWDDFGFVMKFWIIAVDIFIAILWPALWSYKITDKLTECS